MTIASTRDRISVTLKPKQTVLLNQAPLVSANLLIAGDNNTSDIVSLLTDTLTFTGGTGITTTVTNNRLTITGDDASVTSKGIASFDANDFGVTEGNVSLNPQRVQEILSNALLEGSIEIDLIDGGTF